MERPLKFHLVIDLPDKYIVPPLASSKLMPAWIKKMPTHASPEMQTVKRCIPFLDAMTMGYTILNHIDLCIFQKSDGEIRFKYLDHAHETALKMHPPIEVHPSAQVPGTPFEHFTILKYMNPWRIQTPNNYSLLFLPPANRFDLPCIPLVGLVDTDEYKNVVNFPFLIPTLQPDEKEHFIAKGTPIVQVVPVKRENWKQKTTIYNDRILAETKKHREDISSDREDHYRRKLWRRKVYN